MRFEAELFQRVDTGSACFDERRVELFQPVLSCSRRRANTGLTTSSASQITQAYEGFLFSLVVRGRSEVVCV